MELLFCASVVAAAAAAGKRLAQGEAVVPQHPQLHVRAHTSQRRRICAMWATEVMESEASKKGKY